MNEQEFVSIQCPYCWESMELVIDCSIGQQEYIEDCQICCRPINIIVSIEEEQLMVEVASENE